MVSGKKKKKAARPKAQIGAWSPQLGVPVGKPNPGCRCRYCRMECGTLAKEAEHIKTCPARARVEKSMASMQNGRKAPGS